MGSFNPSASAEANAIKVQGNTINLGRPQGANSAIRGLVRLIAPVTYERREAAARDVRVDSLIANAEKILRTFPGWNEQRSILESAGYRVTNEQAKNVAAVLDGAQDIIDRSDSDVIGLSPESRDFIIEGSKGAYDQKAREMWSRAAAGEAERPGSFSRRTMSILADMSAYECAAFAKLCSFCVAVSSGNRPLLVLHEEKGVRDFNGGVFTYDERSALESIGLIDCGIRRLFTLEKRCSCSLIAGNELVEITNNGPSEREFSFSPCFTKFGYELAKLCQIGTGDRLSEFLSLMASEQGFVSRVNLSA